MTKISELKDSLEKSRLLKELSSKEIEANPELFWHNEYLMLTGEWFTPLPGHFWQLKKGMEFDVDYDGELISLSFFNYLGADAMFSAFLNKSEWQYFHFSKIKRMRIRSFEVKNG